MAQFDLYQGTGNGCELLVDLQDEMLSGLTTRVVAPLVTVDAVGPPMRTVNPQLAFAGKQYVLLTHLLAAIPVAHLGQPVGSAALQSQELIAALDLLFTGV